MFCNRYSMFCWFAIGGLLAAAPPSLLAQDEACCLPDNTCVVIPVSDCIDQGGTPMGLPTCDGVICDGGPTDYLFEFSLDIGSDKELSDPFMDGDEAFDPGDVYWWQSAPVLPPGRDGFKDDTFIFFGDPWPDPPDALLATRVPVGEGDPSMFWDYFDLDGHDQIDVSLHEVQWIPPDEWLWEPIPQFPSDCIHKTEFLMVSFDDDMAPSWPANDVPVTAPSPAGVSSYGSTFGMDEIMGVTLAWAPGTPPPYPVAAMYPIADETTVHSSLAPNPDGIEEEDDDVDSLDIVAGEEECPFWYFSPDHEASLGMDPGGIYEVTMGIPTTQVIDEFIHLGIPEDTDIDAFEFVWLEYEPEPGMLFLAILYSVDDDDPLTVIDESGGMDPTVVYGSHFLGYSYQISDRLHDDIDALTVWKEPLEEPEPTGACCLADCACAVMFEVDCVNAGGVWYGPGTDCTDGDGNGVADLCETCIGDTDCDGFVDLSDLAQLLANFGATSGMGWKDGDFDNDGDVDLSDLAALLAVFNQPCP